MVKNSLCRLLGLVALVALTFSALGAASFASTVGSAGSASATASVAQSTPSGTPVGHVTISVTVKGGTSTASATHTTSSEPTPKSYPPDPCLEVFFFTLSAVNTNEAKATGEVYNNCGFTIKSGRTDVYGYVQCNGVSQAGSDYGNWYTLYPGGIMSFDAYVTGRCEVCDNGKAVAWPSFTLVVQIDASGTGSNNQAVEDTGTAEKSITLPNSPSYSFPCP